MEKSKRKFWAKEILIFWVSLVVMVITYLVSLGVVEVIIYFKNKEVHDNNIQLAESASQKLAEIDSLNRIPQFVSNQTEKEGNESKRKTLFKMMVKDGYYSKSYSDFKNQFCFDSDKQLKLYNLLSNVYDIGSFEEFQEKLSGDYRNPTWQVSQKKIQDGWLEVTNIRGKSKGKWENKLQFKYFGLAWFLIVYPLRVIVLSIVWAYRTLKEK